MHLAETLPVKLNELALRRCERLVENAQAARVAVVRDLSGVRIVDCGIHVRGGIEAGCALAEVCLADLGSVRIVPGDPAVWPGPAVVVQTDQPIAACMASQYAGWQLGSKSFFAMGSGPMRAARGREPLFDQIGYREKPDVAVGILETGKSPPDDVCRRIAEDCGVDPERLTLLVAPTASLAGSIQIVARTVETALHKLHEVGFDLRRIVSGFGSAPLPPVAANDLQGIGRTNDAVLYGGVITLWVEGDDDSLTTMGPRVPSSASPDHGRPFIEIFERYQRDFYRIDPLLFSPAVVRFVNVQTGRSWEFGSCHPDILRASFSG